MHSCLHTSRRCNYFPLDQSLRIRTQGYAAPTRQFSSGEKPYKSISASPVRASPLHKPSPPAYSWAQDNPRTSHPSTVTHPPPVPPRAIRSPPRTSGYSTGAPPPEKDATAGWREHPDADVARLGARPVPVEPQVVVDDDVREDALQHICREVPPRANRDRMQTRVRVSLSLKVAGASRA